MHKVEERAARGGEANRAGAVNPNAGFDTAGTGNQLTVWLVRRSQRKRRGTQIGRTYGACGQSSTLQLEQQLLRRARPLEERNPELGAEASVQTRKHVPALNPFQEK
jgi:hypothetical protein